MRVSRQLGWFVVVRLAALCFLFCFPLPSSGQDMNVTGASNCVAADFDTKLTFINGPGNYYGIVVNKRNISSNPCVFDGPMYGPSLLPDRVEGHKPYDPCYYCEDRLPNGQTPVIPPITVNPGQIARQTFRWKTTSLSVEEPSLQLKWMAGPVLVDAPSLLKRVCSDIEVSRFSLTESSEDDQIPQFKLTADRNLYYEGEFFSVRLSSTHNNSQTAAVKDGCPTLYVRQRSPDGATRIDEVQPLGFKDCGRRVLGNDPGDWQSGFDLDSGANSRWSGAGEHSVEVLQLAGSVDDSRLEFMTSNVLRIQIADPALILRKWGPALKGVAADITLDKETFRVGEDVPLHMAIENFDAAVPIYSWDALWDPCLVVAIEVRDTGGHPLPESERLPQSSICTGHGFGPRPVAKDKVIPIERTLRKEGWLPNHPGTYYVVMTWVPCYDAKKRTSSTGQSTHLKPYAVVHATATIQVLPADSSHAN